MNFAKTRSSLTRYQLGRLISYVTVGALLGAFGHMLWRDDQTLWISALSLGLISLLLIVNGYRAVTGKPLHLRLPVKLQRILTSLFQAAKVNRFPPGVTSFLAGLMTVLLPCGHLYSFFLGAVASGSAARGAGFMFAFWLGSTPVLSFGSVWIQKTITKGPARAQRIAGGLLVAAGLFSVLTFGARTFEQYLSREAGQIVPAEIQAPRCH